jgi:hypothetical protein
MRELIELTPRRNIFGFRRNENLQDIYSRLLFIDFRISEMKEVKDIFTCSCCYSRHKYPSMSDDYIRCTGNPSPGSTRAVPLLVIALIMKGQNNCRPTFNTN